jgi:hypothetical protein
MLVFRQAYTEMIIVIVVSLTLLIGGGFVIYNRLTGANFNIEAFSYQQQAWRSQHGFDQWQESASQLETQVEMLTPVQFKQQYAELLQLIPSTYHQYASAARHLSSSRSQIQNLAHQIMASVELAYPEQQFRFIDRIYAMDSLVSIVLDRPLAYLFFLESASGEELLIQAWYPDSATSYQQTSAWYFSEQQIPSQDFLDNLLTLYSKNIR